jgi:hypothetical protein
MTNLIYKNETLKLDNAAGTLTDLTAYITSETLSGSQDTIEDSAMADEERSYLAGMAGATLTLAGIVNSTTDAILAPLLGNRTTATKTYQRAATTNLILRGEFLPTAVEYSGSNNSLQTFSFSGTLDGVMIKTSVAL